MDKLKYVEAADLGCDELSDSEVDAVHVNVKGSVTTRRTRVLKGVKLDKSYEPPSHYMCESFCCLFAFINLTFLSDAHARLWILPKSRSTTWTAMTVASLKSACSRR
jgi:hypothetical protein